jgi:hypothetical protein
VVADVRVVAATVAGGRIENLRVSLHGLPERTLDRAAVLSWMKDGHSLIPVRAGRRGTALQLVEVGEELFVRGDNAPEASDHVPGLPSL